MHSTATHLVPADPRVSWPDRLGSCLTGADLIITVDLRDLDHRPVDRLRLLLVADVLRRVVEETQGAHVTSAILPHRAQPARPLELLPAALHILPATSRRAGSPHEGEPTGPPARITLVSTDPSRPTEPATGEQLLPVGGVLPRGVERDLFKRLAGSDPLTARLALLRFTPPETAVLSSARLHRASETLDRWRFKVASWKDSPPKPAEQLGPLLALLVNGCDTSTVLRLLHRIEVDHGIPSGAKYQTFVHLDRVLGLDLTRRQFGPNVW